jgi:hypothetical protein
MRRFVLPFLLLALTLSSLQVCRAQVFVGSTPCEDLTRRQLKIPDGTPCEFVKWVMRLEPAGSQKGNFSFAAEYGESRPNTNGFKIPTKIQVSGTYTVLKPADSPWQYYHLTGAGIEGNISLIRMDENIFHFGGKDESFLTGNGGFGYVLNREPKM